MSNEFETAVNKEVNDFLNFMKKREEILAVGRAIEELGRRVVYRVDMNAASADLNEEDQERVRAARTQVGKVGDTDA